MRAVFKPLLFIIGTAGLLGAAGCGETPPENKLNVMMIVSDALRQDVLGCYGGEARTPNIDWLAQNGVRFENSYSTSPWTSPSVIGMITGNHATSYHYAVAGRHRLETARSNQEYAELPRIYVPDDEFLFAEALRDRGYLTEMQIENINASMHNNFQGFEYIEQYQSTIMEADTIDRIIGGGHIMSWKNLEGYWHNFYVLRRLKNISPGANFFLLYWMLDPHSPYDPPEKFAARIEVDDSRLPEPRKFYTTGKFNRQNRTDEENRYIRALYIAEVESVDERVGFVLKMLRHKKMLENTIIVFTSDHGEQFGEHGLYEHGGHGIGCHYYEGLLRVPLIMAGPGVPKGRTVPGQVSLLGLIPTLREMMGIEYGQNTQGRSFYPLITGQDRPARELFFDDIQDHDQIDALLSANFKLITLKDGSFELYDVLSDHQELTNLASGQAGKIESMLEKIEGYRRENEERRRKNLAALGDRVDDMSPEERQEILKKLKSLGYID